MLRSIFGLWLMSDDTYLWPSPPDERLPGGRAAIVYDHERQHLRQFTGLLKVQCAEFKINIRTVAPTPSHQCVIPYKYVQQ